MPEAMNPMARHMIIFVKKIPSNCPLARADFAQKQSKEEWQRKGQEAVDMLLTHGAKEGQPGNPRCS